MLRSTPLRTCPHLPILPSLHGRRYDINWWCTTHRSRNRMRLIHTQRYLDLWLYVAKCRATHSIGTAQNVIGRAFRMEWAFVLREFNEPWHVVFYWVQAYVHFTSPIVRERANECAVSNARTFIYNHWNKHTLHLQLLCALSVHWHIALDADAHKPSICAHEDPRSIGMRIFSLAVPARWINNDFQ